MSRKIFGPTTDAPKPVEGGLAERTNPLRTRPILNSPELVSRGAQPVGALGASLNRLSERSQQAHEIEKKLAAGQAVIEIDTGLIDPSFVSDRMPLSDDALADLVEAIRQSTQLSPILVRPHPEQPGRYQTAFGHRRVRAVALLGIPVRAIVRELTDEEMVVAQGQENNARKDLSFIEKARFARKLEGRQFSRNTIMAALSVYKSDLSNMLSVAHSVPEDLIDAIGPAPHTGRRGWIELAEAFKIPKAIEAARKAVAAPLVQAQDSDARFKVALAAIKEAPQKAKIEMLTNGQGAKVAKISSSDDRLIIAIDRKTGQGFAEFLEGKLPQIHAEFERTKNGRNP